jgi:hypothetical protein
MLSTGFNIDVPAILRWQAGEWLQVNAVSIGVLTFTILLRLYLLWAMGQGVGAINTLKKETPPTPS